MSAYYQLIIDIMKRLCYIMILSFLTFNLFAQNSIKDRLSYSISWTPMYYGIHDYGFSSDLIKPVSFEAKIHYRIAGRFSISTGIGYQTSHHTSLDWEFLPGYDPSQSIKACTNVIKLPIQINYFLTKEDKNFIPYIKSEFVNEFATNWNKFYQDDKLNDSMSTNYYSNTIDLGLGALIKINNTLNLFTEVSYGKYLVNHSNNDYLIKAKIGIMFK